MPIGNRVFAIEDIDEANRIAHAILCKNATQDEFRFRIQNNHYFGELTIRVWKDKRHE